MSKPKTQKAQRDEAYLASAAKLDEAIPGQLDIDGSAVGANVADLPPKNPAIPDRCPKCGRVQTYAAGWTLIRGPGTLAEPLIMCGNCGASWQVPSEAWGAYRDDVRAYFGRVDAVKPKRDPHAKRQRGAG